MRFGQRNDGACESQHGEVDGESDANMHGCGCCGLLEDVLDVGWRYWRRICGVGDCRGVGNRADLNDGVCTDTRLSIHDRQIDYRIIWYMVPLLQIRFSRVKIDLDLDETRLGRFL